MQHMCGSNEGLQSVNFAAYYNLQTVSITHLQHGIRIVFIMALFCSTLAPFKSSYILHT